MLYGNGGVSPHRAHVAAIALCSAVLRLPFTVSERAALAWQLRRSPAMPAPLFVIGHWRSGTTHLANVLSRSPRFGILPPIAVGLPWEALGLARLIGPYIEQYLPRNRLIDDIALAPDLPQEDELALANMTPLSYYHGLYFPQALEANFNTGLFLEDCPEARIRTWAGALRQYVAKMTLHQGRRPLLIRNPVYSTRIPLLRAIWPDAKFIHIYRNPYAVYASSRRMFTTLLRELALQDAVADVDALVLRTYPRLMARLLEDAAMLPSGSFAEIRFETFRQNSAGRGGARLLRTRLGGLRGGGGAFRELSSFCERLPHRRPSVGSIGPRSGRQELGAVHHALGLRCALGIVISTQPTGPLDESRHVRDAGAGADIGEHERTLAAHPARVAVHHLQAGADQRGEIGLVDHQQVAPGDSRPALARDLVSRRDVDHVDRRDRPAPG